MAGCHGGHGGSLNGAAAIASSILASTDVSLSRTQAMEEQSRVPQQERSNTQADAPADVANAGRATQHDEPTNGPEEQSQRVERQAKISAGLHGTHVRPVQGHNRPDQCDQTEEQSNDSHAKHSFSLRAIWVVSQAVAVSIKSFDKFTRA
eukprot:GILJ01019786.1.p2 GENE.GILJ01019786.1~~GILJ01019786.1.p2  ORF type:complete len:150 (+),score=14.85 GILJ01019786.1:250-699(+)